MQTTWKPSRATSLKAQNKCWKPLDAAPKFTGRKCEQSEILGVTGAGHLEPLETEAPLTYQVARSVILNPKSAILALKILKVQSLHWKSLKCNPCIDIVIKKFLQRSLQIIFTNRPERWFVTIPLSDQWFATIGNHWKTIATNGFGDQKPFKNHC